MAIEPLYDGSVELISGEIVFRGNTMRMVQLTEKHEKPDGEITAPFTWSACQRKSGVAILIHHLPTNQLLFVEQFRAATLIPHKTEFDGIEPGHGRVLELVAGGLNVGEDPEVCARRETFEEAGIELERLNWVSRFFLSPGGTNEDIYLYYAPLKTLKVIGAGGGLAEENEDITLHWIELEKVKEMLLTGEICDAKTLIGIQWLLLNM